MKLDRALSMLGIAAKAGKVVSGEFSTEKAVKSYRAELVLVAKDASDNTKKLFRDKCSFYQVACYEYADKEALGQAIGKQFRASVAVTDKGLADAIVKQIEQNGQQAQ